MSKQQIADLYRTTRQNIEHHIGNIYKDGELNKNATCKQLLQVRREGNRLVRRETDYYNLDMIIALGYRIQSEIAVRVRVWANAQRHETEKRVPSLGLPKIRPPHTIKILGKPILKIHTNKRWRNHEPKQ